MSLYIFKFDKLKEKKWRVAVNSFSIEAGWRRTVCHRAASFVITAERRARGVRGARCARVLSVGRKNSETRRQREETVREVRERSGQKKAEIASCG